MIQLPEPCKEDSQAYKANYKTIAEIGKERIQRVCDKTKADNPLTAKDLDIGFRVFRVGESNIPNVVKSGQKCQTAGTLREQE